MAKQTIRPLEDRVVIQQIEAEEKTAGGIVLPDTAKEKPQRGKVLAVGPGKLLDSGERAPIGVVEGDEVLFGKYSGTEIKVDGRGDQDLARVGHSGQDRQVTVAWRGEVADGGPARGPRLVQHFDSWSNRPCLNNCFSQRRLAAR